MMCPMYAADQGSIRPECGSTETGSLFCKSCGATIREPISLIPSSPPDFSLPSIRLWKRIPRGMIKVIAAIATLLFIFDNRASGIAGVVLVASATIFVLCFLAWRVFNLGDDDWFGPRKSS